MRNDKRQDHQMMEVIARSKGTQPLSARWSLRWYGYVRYFRSQVAAQRALNNLSWYSRQDATIHSLSRG